MTREGAQAPQPPPIPSTPQPLKPRHNRAAEEYRERLLHRARQSSNLREKVVQLASQKDNEVAAYIHHFHSAQRPGKQQQQQPQHHPPEQATDGSVEFNDLKSAGETGEGVGVVQTGLGHGPGEWEQSGWTEPNMDMNSSPSHAAGQGLTLDARSQNRLPHSPPLPRSAATRFCSMLPQPPTCLPGNKSTHSSPKQVVTSGDHRHRRSLYQSSSFVPSEENRSQGSPRHVHDEGYVGERCQENDSAIPFSSSTPTTFRTRTSGRRSTARTLRNPSQNVVNQRASDLQDTSAASTTPRSQTSQGHPSPHDDAKQTASTGIPENTASPKKGKSQSLSTPCLSRQSHKQMSSGDTSGPNVLKKSAQENPTSSKGHILSTSNSAFRSVESNKRPVPEYVTRCSNSWEVPEESSSPPNGHTRSPPGTPSRRGRSLTVRRAARALRGNHPTLTTGLEQQRRFGKWKERESGHSKSVRFQSDNSCPNYSSGSSGGSPRPAGSRGVEETVGEVKGNAVAPSTHHHLHPQLSPRRADHKNPSHFATSLEMFKRRLKMNQQRVVTENFAAEGDYVIRLEHVTSAADHSWQPVSSGLNLRPSAESHLPQHSPPPQRYTTEASPRENPQRNPRYHQTQPNQTQVFSPSDSPQQTHTSDCGLADLSTSISSDGGSMQRARGPGRKDGRGRERVLERREKQVGEEVEKEEREGGGGGGIVEEERVKEQAATPSATVPESPVNWTDVPLGNTARVPLPQVKTYVVENTLTTRGQDRLPLALTQHNVRLHDVFLQRRSSQRLRMRQKQEEPDRRAGLVWGGIAGGVEIRWVGRGASADAESRMRRWLMETEIQRDEQQPLVNFKIAIPAA